MSIRKKPEQAVTLLLARLDKAKLHFQPPDANDIQAKFEEFKKELESMRDVFPDIKSWEKTMMGLFSDMEQELGNGIFQDSQKKSEVLDKLGQMMSRVIGLKQLIPRVDKKGISKTSDLHTDDDHQTVWPECVSSEVEKMLLENELMSSFLASFHCLSGSQQAKMCSLCLSVFPLNSIIEKKPLIYWWIGEGLVMKTAGKTAEEVGEQVFAELLDEGFVKASTKNKSQSVNSFTIDPWIHRMLIQIASENNLFEFEFSGPQWTPCNGRRRVFLWRENAAGSNNISGDQGEANETRLAPQQKNSVRGQENDSRSHNISGDPIMVFNVNEKYLRMKPEWLSKLSKVEVLQMGRWQNSIAHHIEVEQQSLFNALGSQKHLKYLSLRGISRIETLPASISKLVSLQILDLRACHNLEKLPPTISRLKNLTHLDVSHCYLLESMPKGLEHLSALQVIKGFVIGRAEKNSCKISDLVQLQKLRKLSIRLGETQQDHELQKLRKLSERLGETQQDHELQKLRKRSIRLGETQQDHELGSLGTFPALRILTISWGDVDSSAQMNAISLPPMLSKLDLRCVPFESLPDWLFPSKLPRHLTKLYIKGGKLKSLEKMDEQEWNVKYLRFRYLPKLNTSIEAELRNYKRLDEFDCYELRSDITSTTSA